MSDVRDMPRGHIDIPSIFRRLIIAWLTSALIEYILLPAESRTLGEIAMLGLTSPVRAAAVAVIVFAALSALSIRFETVRAERFAMVAVFALLAASTLMFSFTWAYLCACALILLAFIVYAVSGHDTSAVKTPAPVKESRIFLWITLALAVAFVIFDGIWTVCRVRGFSTPTFDFGIFAQMFYHMKTTGLPNTTVERDGLLSHLAVHMSPIYYILLPFYMLFPVPETIEVLQGIVLASSVIPLYLLAKQHGHKGLCRVLLCAILLLFPAIAGGTSYDIHENCFLTPLILWLFYGIDKKSVPVISLSLVLLLSVKEDAAVYAAVIALYLIVRTLLSYDKDRRDLVTGIAILIVSVLYFVLASAYLNIYGDGDLSSARYPNFIIDDGSPLPTIIKTAILLPMKILFECCDASKLSFIGLTLLPLLCIPFFTRRYESMILLIPYILVNLISDYQYMHDVFFQYVFGSAAFLFYMVSSNLRDIEPDRTKLMALLAAGVVSVTCFSTSVIPRAVNYIDRAVTYKGYYDELRETLDIIPADATVTATTFYTTYLSQRDVLYDVRYSSQEHMLSTEYIVLAVSEDRSYTKYNGYDSLVHILETNGYEKIAAFRDSAVIYHKTTE